MLNYIREYRQDYTIIFWIEAGSKESIERDYIQIYRLLYSRQVDIGHEMVKVEDAVPAVKRWFHGREGRWLVILDSADAIDDDQQRAFYVSRNESNTAWRLTPQPQLASPRQFWHSLAF